MNILFPVLAGSEFRQFFLSGIITDLINEGNSIYIIVKDDNEFLRNEILSFESRVIIIPHIKNKIERTFFSYLHTALDNWYDSRHNRWRYSPKSKISFPKLFLYKSLNHILDIGFVNKLALRLESRLLVRVKTPAISELLKKHSIEKIVVNNARFLFYPELLIAAQKTNIPVDVIYHTNKEAFAQPRLSYKYRVHGVWNTEMKEDLISRYQLKDKDITISGNTHFSYLFDRNFVMPFNDFRKMFTIENDSGLILLYTAAGIIVQNEYLIVKEICSFLSAQNADFKIIVRQNPMDTSETWRDAFEEEKNVIIQKPKWFMDLQLGLNYTQKEDMVEYASLLNYATCCINIPSTVTLEAAIMRKPVVNICYDFPGLEITTNNGSVRDFWEAPYYRQFYDKDFVMAAFNKEELFKSINRVVSGKVVFNDFEKCVTQILPFDVHSMKSATENIIKTLKD